MAVIVKKVRDKWLALGLASHFVARSDTFARFPAGDLVRTLSGQTERGHYLFALDTAANPARVCGYFGWALYDNAAAERFAQTGAPPAELGSGGDVLWILTAVADNRSAFVAMVKEVRALYPAHRIMGIRHKAAGRRFVFDRSAKAENDETAVAD